jgi:hypothetical protein
MSDSGTECPAVGIGRERQLEVYVGGARGMYPTVPVSFEKLDQRDIARDFVQPRVDGHGRG